MTTPRKTVGYKHVLIVVKQNITLRSLYQTSHAIPNMSFKSFKKWLKAPDPLKTIERTHGFSKTIERRHVLSFSSNCTVETNLTIFNKNVNTTVPYKNFSLLTCFECFPKTIERTYVFLSISPNTISIKHFVCTCFPLNCGVKKHVLSVFVKTIIDIGRCGMSANETTLHPSNNL